MSEEEKIIVYECPECGNVGAFHDGDYICGHWLSKEQRSCQVMRRDWAVVAVKDAYADWESEHPSVIENKNDFFRRMENQEEERDGE